LISNLKDILPLAVATAAMQWLENDVFDMLAGASCDNGPLEVGLTALAVPVDVNLTAPPTSVTAHDSQLVDFGQCQVGCQLGLTLTLTNNSQVLPATFQFRRMAHYSIQPCRGHLQPGQSCDVVATFAPNQIGNFVQLPLYSK
jgi:hypothetical protein